METKKKRNPQDATLRNIRALRACMEELRVELAMLMKLSEGGDRMACGKKKGKKGGKK